MKKPKEVFTRSTYKKAHQSIYRIERVIRKRQKANGTREALVKWAGYGDKFNSWMPAADIIKSGAALQNA